MDEDRPPRWLVNLAIIILAVIPVLLVEVPIGIALFIFHVNPWYVCLLILPSVFAGAFAMTLGTARRNMLIQYGYEKNRRKSKTENPKHSMAVCNKCGSRIVLDSNDYKAKEVDCPVCAYTISFLDKHTIITKEDL